MDIFDNPYVSGARRRRSSTYRGDPQVYLRAYRRCLKVHWIHTVAFGLCFVFSMGAAFALSNVNFQFGDSECLLGSQFVFELETDEGLRQLDERETNWGDVIPCNIVQYGSVTTAMVAFVFCWFFGLFQPYKDAFHYRKPTFASKLILPTVLLSLIITVFALVSVTILADGVNKWNLKLANGSSFTYVGEIVRIVDQSRVIKNYHNFVSAAQILSWLSVAAWIFLFLTVLYRFIMHLDFPAYFFNADDIRERRMPAINAEFSGSFSTSYGSSSCNNSYDSEGRKPSSIKVLHRDGSVDKKAVAVDSIAGRDILTNVVPTACTHSGSPTLERPIDRQLTDAPEPDIDAAMPDIEATKPDIEPAKPDIEAAEVATTQQQQQLDKKGRRKKSVRYHMPTTDE